MELLDAPPQTTLEADENQFAGEESEDEYRLQVAAETARLGTWELELATGAMTCSDQCKANFGRPPDAPFSYEDLLEAIHPGDVSHMREAVDSALEEHDDYSAEYRARWPDGSMHWLQAQGRAFYDDAGKPSRMIGVTRDITGRKRQEQLQEEQTRLMELIASGAPLEECLSSLCAAVPRLNPGVRASVLLADDECQSFHRPIAPDLLPSFGEGLKGAPINSLAIGTCGTAVYEGKPVTCRDIANDDKWSKPWRDLCVAHDVLACHSAPIRNPDGAPQGSFMLCFNGPRPPNEWEQRLSDFGTHIASIALERKQAEEALREANETLEQRVAERTAQVRALSSRLTMAEQQERRRLAGILHDTLQQRLYGIQMKMALLRRHAASGERARLLDEARQAEGWMDEAIATTRQLSVDLSPPVLKKEGLADALGWLQMQMKELHGLAFDLEADQTVRLSDEDMRVFLFQVVRELLFNIVKHAGVDHAAVEITGTDDDLVIRVADEGRGFDPDEVEKQSHDETFGLTAAHERLALFGGGLEIESAPGEGTRMTIRTPLDRKRHDAESG